MLGNRRSSLGLLALCLVSTFVAAVAPQRALGAYTSCAELQSFQDLLNYTTNSTQRLEGWIGARQHSALCAVMGEIRGFSVVINAKASSILDLSRNGMPELRVPATPALHRLVNLAGVFHRNATYGEEYCTGGPETRARPGVLANDAGVNFASTLWGVQTGHPTTRTGLYRRDLNDLQVALYEIAMTWGCTLH